MLFVADVAAVAFTSNIQASGSVIAPTMCMHSVRASSILWNVLYKSFYCFHNLFTLSQEISIFHLLIKEL